MGLTYPGIPKTLVSQLLSNFEIPNFVETGTYLGDTAYWASHHFKNVYTIEYSESHYFQAKEKYHDLQNIRFLIGDSRELLQEIVPQLQRNTLFWLDAHWSGGTTSKASIECPLIQELQAINTSLEENFILIDDARFFLSPPPPPHSYEEWPNLVTIMNLLNNEKNKRFVVVVQDVIVAVPLCAKLQVISYCQEVNTPSWENNEKRKQQFSPRLYRKLRNFILRAIKTNKKPS